MRARAVVVGSWMAVVALVGALGAAPASAQERRRAAPAPATQDPVSTGFDPRRDGLPFGNAGDLASPNGNCWGMSLLAIDNFLRRQERGRGGARFPTGGVSTTWRPSEADPVAQATAGLAQATASRLDLAALPARQPLGDPAPIREALGRVARTGTPEVLVVTGPQGGHAVVLYGYRDGALRVYDPNFPGEGLAWPWDPARGLGRHPRATDGDFYATLTGAATTPFDAHRAGAALGRLREACAAQATECTGRYPSLRAGLERTADGGVVVTGQARPAAEGGARPARVWLALDGQPIGSAEVSRFGTFRAVVPPAALAGEGERRLRLVGEVDDRGWAQFAGFADLTVPTPAAEPRRTPGGPPTRGLRGALGDATGAPRGR